MFTGNFKNFHKFVEKVLLDSDLRSGLRRIYLMPIIGHYLSPRDFILLSFGFHSLVAQSPTLLARQFGHWATVWEFST